MLKRALRDYAGAQAFHPTWGGIFVNPFFIARRGLAREMAAMAPELKGNLLDVGCGSKPYARLFTVDSYVGLDIDTPATRALGKADFFYDGGRFPFKDHAFDAVLCNEVLEHVFDARAFLAEIVRVMRPGALLLLTVPFVWDEHEQPRDFARYSSFGLRWLLEQEGLVLTQQRKLAADASVVFQLANAYLYKALPRSAALRYLVCALVMAPISALGLLLGKLLPANADLYLDQVVLARKP